MTRLTAADGIKLGLCGRGQRRFCDANGINFRDFVRNGIDVADLKNIDDANMKKAIAAAEKREAENGR